ncbi:HalOD1 output domain-containing protein [Halosolutus halophilus]|uniref:HalOD1 output domain-containing protein n=1 Tax=Halosolutus halophilus TaxID=1552990 RepID=UPI0022352585|nr:HalOD1 output domain-containing protein [Halosolutus halophilus]
MYDAIDPEALDSLIKPVATGPSSLEIRFTYAGQRIIIEGRGAISVENYRMGQGVIVVADTDDSMDWFSRRYRYILFSLAFRYLNTADRRRPNVFTVSG